jgi:hypothetical protein
MTHDSGSCCRENVERCLLCCLKMLIWILPGREARRPRGRRNDVLAMRPSLCLATILQDPLGSPSKNERSAQRTRTKRRFLSVKPRKPCFTLST